MPFKKESEYLIVDASETVELMKLVAKYMANGWIPIGGVAINSREIGCDIFYQAMIKE